uniref:Uncharacterized protein n=1 Tax=Rhizophora mucronata TaxID=61149 RepID=A0A2P2ITT3_RHIMU
MTLMEVVWLQFSGLFSSWCFVREEEEKSNKQVGFLPISKLAFIG